MVLGCSRVNCIWKKIREILKLNINRHHSVLGLEVNVEQLYKAQIMQSNDFLLLCICYMVIQNNISGSTFTAFYSCYFFLLMSSEIVLETF